MPDTPATIAFYSSEERAHVEEQVFTACETAGFEIDERNLEGDNIVETERGDIYIRWDDLRFGVRFETEQRPPEAPLLSVGLGQKIYPSTVTDSAEYQNRLDALFELQCRVATAVDADYAPMFNQPVRDAIPKGRVIGETVPDAPRIGVYSPSILEEFGGLDTLFEEYPWYIAELHDQKVAVVGCRDFWEQGGWEPPIEADFLKSATFHDATTDDPNLDRLSDPFTALARGDYGADVCLNRDDISESFPNEDIELVRVYVDKDRNLRRISDDSFVRNVVDADFEDDIEYIQGMLAKVPPTATDEEVMVSTLLQGAIPPSFIRLDGPDDENVVTRVMELNTTVSKHELLVSLGRVAQQDEFTTEDLQTMESALDNLAEVADVDGVDQYIEQNLL